MSANFITPFDSVNAPPQSLSIVSTLYCSERFVMDFIRRVSAVAAKCCENYEIILVDDGSPDKSFDKALLLQNQFPRILIVQFSRNFGHHSALFAGLCQAKGDAVFLIDSDLEENPELLLDFWEAMQRDPSIDVTYGIQSGRRKGGFVERVTGDLFYRIFASLCEIKYDANQLTARLMSRNYVNEVLRYSEREFDLWGLFSLTGFRQVAVPTVKGSKGISAYTLKHKFAMAYDMITTLSARPLFFIFLLGILTTILSFAMLAYFLILHLIVPGLPMGWASLIVSLWFLGGLIISSIGVIGLYLSKVFLEVKQRPRYHVRQVIPAIEKIIK